MQPARHARGVAEAGRDADSQTSRQAWLVSRGVRGRMRPAPDVYGFGRARRTESDAEEPRQDREDAKAEPVRIAKGLGLTPVAVLRFEPKSLCPPKELQRKPIRFGSACSAETHHGG